MAAKRLGAAELVDPRPFAVGGLRDVFATYPHIGKLLPAMGYGDKQIAELAQTIAGVECDAVLIATPVDLRRLFQIRQPTVRLTYGFEERGTPTLDEVLLPFIQQALAASARSCEANKAP